MMTDLSKVYVRVEHDGKAMENSVTSIGMSRVLLERSLALLGESFCEEYFGDGRELPPMNDEHTRHVRAHIRASKLYGDGGAGTRARVIPYLRKRKERIAMENTKDNVYRLYISIRGQEVSEPPDISDVEIDKVLVTDDRRLVYISKRIQEIDDDTRM
jgi:hypothetical protein